MSITEVAKLAGVSSSTVSRVINNHPRVAPETIELVHRAMRQLNYVPSERRPGPKPSFRTRTGATTIGFLVLGASSEQSTPGFSELLRGVSTAASQHNLDLLFHYVPDRDQMPPRLLDQHFDGLLLHGAMPSSEFRQRIRKIPTVWLMGNRTRPDWGDQVMPDAYAIGDLAAKYLLRRGHAHVAFLNVDGMYAPFKLSQLAFQAAALAEGATVATVVETPSGTVLHGHYGQEQVERVMERFLKLDPQPTGVYIADDIQAALLQPALQARGVEFGREKVDVISCNNERPYLVGLTPRPATIDIRVESIGRRGVEQVMWRLEHLDVMERIVSMVEPVVLPADGTETAGKAPPA